VTPTAQQRGGPAPAKSLARTLARGVLMAAIVFTMLYTGYAAVSIFVSNTWESTVPRPLAEAALVLGTLVCAEMVVLGLNASFLRDRLVPRERMPAAYGVLGATAAAAFALALAGDPRFAAALGSLVLPGAAAYGILAMFSPAYIARQEERARERAAARGARSGRTGTPRPPSKPSRQRTQTSVKSRQRKGGRKRH
jgi:amino acid transporter